jgi:Thiamine pyrophosphate-requiring enzymes [acetolactate synthase, pyruvate dehydrogenase (cytochrome), glyoxylate carboligase, phosphonopyruvate decarboxylase]
MGKSAADVIVETLVEAGVERVYGVPGDSIDPIVDALRRNESIKYVQVRHEEGAAFAASAEAKLTSKLTACMGTSGPGSIHLLNGLYDAKMDHAPVVALTGQVESDLLGTDYFQEVDLVKLFDDVAIFNHMLVNPKTAGMLAARAAKEALIKRGMAHLNLPVDLLREDGGEAQHIIVPKLVYSANVDQAVEAIDSSERPVVFIGGGTRGTTDLLNAFAEKIGAPVVYALNGKGVLPDADPKVMGGIGLLGTRPSVEALGKTDLLIMLGTSFPYVKFLPIKTKVMQVDIDPSNLGKRVPVDLPVVASTDAFLRAINGKVKEKGDKFYEQMRHSKEEWLKDLSKDEESDKKPMKPQRVAATLSKYAPKDSVVAVDTGNVTMWGARNFKASGQTFLFSAWLGSMGFSMPAAVGAAMAGSPHVLALAGDGGFVMTMTELITAKKYSLPVKVVVFNNSKLGMIKFEQEVMGYPEWGVDLYNPDFELLAKSVGAGGATVEDPKDLESAVKEMFQYEGPFLLNAVVDPNERPMPPKMTFTQAKNYVLSLFKERLEPL